MTWRKLPEEIIIIPLLKGKISSLKKGKGKVALLAQNGPWEGGKWRHYQAWQCGPTQIDSSLPRPDTWQEKIWPQQYKLDTADGRNSSQKVVSGSPMIHQNPLDHFYYYCLEGTVAALFFQKRWLKTCYKIKLSHCFSSSGFFPAVAWKWFSGGQEDSRFGGEPWVLPLKSLDWAPGPRTR